MARLICYLLFNPNIFEQLQYRKVKRTITLIILLCAASSVIISISAVVSLHSSSKQWEAWFKSDVREFGKTSDGKFFWKFPKCLPYVTYINDWLVEISNDSIDDKADSEIGHADKGLWISPEGIYYWKKIPIQSFCARQGGYRIVKQELGHLFFSQILEYGEGSIINPLNRAEIINKLFIIIAIVTICLNVITVHFTVLFLPIVTSLLSGFTLRYGPVKHRQSILPKIFVVNLYSAIPPMLIATLYCAMHVPGVTYFTVFIIAYFCYQIYITGVLRRVLSPEGEQH